jgi:hypothetical protein
MQLIAQEGLSRAHETVGELALSQTPAPLGSNEVCTRVAHDAVPCGDCCAQPIGKARADCMLRAGQDVDNYIEQPGFLRTTFSTEAKRIKVRWHGADTLRQARPCGPHSHRALPRDGVQVATLAEPMPTTMPAEQPADETLVEYSDPPR